MITAISEVPVRHYETICAGCGFLIRFQGEDVEDNVLTPIAKSMNKLHFVENYITCPRESCHAPTKVNMSNLVPIYQKINKVEKALTPQEDHKDQQFSSILEKLENLETILQNMLAAQQAESYQIRANNAYRRAARLKESSKLLIVNYEKHRQNLVTHREFPEDTFKIYTGDRVNFLPDDEIKVYDSKDDKNGRDLQKIIDEYITNFIREKTQGVL